MTHFTGQAMQLALLTELDTLARSQPLQDHEPDVVAGSCIFRTWIAQTDHQPQICGHLADQTSGGSLSWDGSAEPSPNSGSAMALLISLSNSLEAD